jgi:magnesium-transporting ATPase (P-type)
VTESDSTRLNPPGGDPEDLLAPAPVDPRTEQFLGGAIGRIRHSMLILGAIAIFLTWFIWDWKIAAGVLLGCVVSYVNFHWLERALNSLAERITHAGSKVSSTGIVFRFLLRYVFIGVGAYVIFKGSPASLYGFLGGLSLTVAAILCEAGYEAYAALRSKI